MVRRKNVNVIRHLYVIPPDGVPWSKIMERAAKQLVGEGGTSSDEARSLVKRDGPSLGGGFVTDHFGIRELAFDEGERPLPKRIQAMVEKKAPGDKVRYKKKDYIIGRIVRDRDLKKDLRVVSLSLLEAAYINREK